MMEMNAGQGMTLVQRTIIGCCLVLAIVGIVFLQVFLRSRVIDLMTLADIARIKSALEFSYAINTKFPEAAQPVLLGSPEDKAERLCVRGFTSITEPCERVLLHAIPAAGSRGYIYSSFDGGQEYRIEFMLMRNHRSLGLMKGVVCAFPQGITQGPCLTQ